MTIESLETLSDEQLRAVIARAGELLKQHDRERKGKALSDARAILASVGLSLKDLGTKGSIAKSRSIGQTKHVPFTCSETGRGKTRRISGV